VDQWFRWVVDFGISIEEKKNLGLFVDVEMRVFGLG
jgi:hypothetical protein